MSNRLNFEFIDLGQRNESHHQYSNSVWKVTLNKIEGLNFKELIDTQIDIDPNTANQYGRESVSYINQPPELGIVLEEVIADLKSRFTDLLFDCPNESIKRQIQNKYPMNKETFAANCNAWAGYYRDPPNLHMPPHVDNGSCVFNMVINLADQCPGTAYHDYITKEIIYQTSGARGEGSAFFNIPGALHSVHNNTQSKRYILNGGIVFNWA